MVRRLSEPAMITPSPAVRSILIAGAVLIALAACGRRGALEAPPDTSATPPGPPSQASRTARPGRPDTETVPAATAADDEDTEESEIAQQIVPTPVPTNRRRSRSYTIPKEPFLLDPLL
jgi:predicted small lipoprotein YifL